MTIDSPNSDSSRRVAGVDDVRLPFAIIPLLLERLQSIGALVTIDATLRRGTRFPI